MICNQILIITHVLLLAYSIRVRDLKFLLRPSVIFIEIGRGENDPVRSAIPFPEIIFGMHFPPRLIAPPFISKKIKYFSELQKLSSLKIRR